MSTGSSGATGQTDLTSVPSCTTTTAYAGRTRRPSSRTSPSKGCRHTGDSTAYRRDNCRTRVADHGSTRVSRTRYHCTVSPNLAAATLIICTARVEPGRTPAVAGDTAEGSACRHLRHRSWPSRGGQAVRVATTAAAEWWTIDIAASAVCRTTPPTERHWT